MGWKSPHRRRDARLNNGKPRMCRGSQLQIWPGLISRIACLPKRAIVRIIPGMLVFALERRFTAACVRLVSFFCPSLPIPPPRRHGPANFDIDAETLSPSRNLAIRVIRRISGSRILCLEKLERKSHATRGGQTRSWKLGFTRLLSGRLNSSTAKSFRAKTLGKALNEARALDKDFSRAQLESSPEVET